MRDFMLVVHFLGLAMALGAGFSNLFLGTVASKLEPAERGKFMSRLLILGRMGQFGLALLLISGFALITPFWKVIGEMPFLIAKLTLVGILLISVSRILYLVSKSQKENNPAVLMKVKPLGMLNFFLGISIVILAVLTFH